MSTQGVDLIRFEREKQIKKHGRTVEHDLKNNKAGQLIKAAQFLIADRTKKVTLTDAAEFKPSGWDDGIWWKLVNKSRMDRLRIAGALIAAELDCWLASDCCGGGVVDACGPGPDPGKWSEFDKVVRPVIKYLAENHNPHTYVVVSNNSSELLSGQVVFETDEYIRD